ncbi:rod shape-determining protein MreC [Paraglaciecola sp. 2405UD69-4]|uniref:rod shape-determining protein MreC n=1 Tax=Paraglaciecola sp. 2405UD69-4 TaxID=3391836 RepID=UPI0039C8CAE1
MNLMFSQGPSLPNRLVLGLLVSIFLILFDHKLNGFATTRVYLNSFVSPLQYLANLPGELLSASAGRLVSHEQLFKENAQLTREALLMSEQLQKLKFLEAENDRLRSLLNSPVKHDRRREVAELMAVDNNPYSLQITINKGALNGVFENQPVLDDRGIVGQIMQVGSTNSRVLLITDVTHAIPVRVARNNVRLIASGTGSLDELIIQHVPHSTDLKEGDLLLSSGLGNVFPEGYPVAEITSIISDDGRPFLKVKAKPIAQLDRLKYLLLLWSETTSSSQLEEEVTL